MERSTITFGDDIPVTDPSAFRAEFPVLERVAYLNAGTNGPVPRRGADAAQQRLRAELEGGRAGDAHWKGLEELQAELRRRLAPLLGCEVGELALTHSTTDGVATVMAALDLGPGDEVLTSDEEHPGLLAPLANAQRRRGFEVRKVPFAELAGEVGPATRLVACSHVSWVSGQIVDAPALAASDASVLLDGAQGLGAIPLDVRELGCDFYAASGQKWLCGPEGTGCLFVRSERIEELGCPWPWFGSLADPSRPSDLVLHETARRFDLAIPGAPAAWWRASLDLFERTGWSWVQERAATLAASLADRLAERGLDVVARGRSTLVAWRSEDGAAERDRLAAEGIVVRDLPGRGLVRASVGAWTSEEELGRLVALAG
jgi:L-cysteine/cystine lyase